MASQLAALTEDDLIRGVDPSELNRAEIYPGNWERPGELGWVAHYLLASQKTEDDDVTPLSVTEFGPPQDTLVLESDLPKGSLFRRILRLGAGLDAVNRSVGEQVSAQHGLRPGAETPSPPLRQQHDPDAAVTTSAVPTRGPADEADDFASNRNDEFAVFVAEPAIALEASALSAGVAEAIPVCTYQFRLQVETANEVQIRFEYRT